MSIPVEKTLEEVRADLFGRISTVQQDGWLPQSLNLNKGVIRGLIELWAWGLYQLYQFLAVVLKQAFPITATGLWLDLHCRQVGVERLSATKAKGRIYFTRSDTTGNVPISKGRIVKTRPDGLGKVYRFVTTADAVLTQGAVEIDVPVEAEDYGAGANVTTGQITEIATVIPGVDGVENREGWLTSEGADREEDEELRERYVLAWRDVNGATRYAYESWARSVAGVVAVKILDQHPRGQGTVDVIVRGAAGLPTQELINTVDGVVQPKRPVNDDALVKGPVPVSVALDAQLELVSGDPVVILAEVENRLNALFLDPSPVPDIVALQIGQDLTLDLLVSVIMAVPGVKRIIWTSPTTDVVIEDDELAILAGITLSYTWAGEI